MTEISIIASVFLLLLFLIILMSSLFFWKHKGKVQNISPHAFKEHNSQTFNLRIQSMPGNRVCPGNHSSLTWEHHKPLVMQPSYRGEISQLKTVPNSESVIFSPKYTLPSSPGPDPYRSQDNIYEEIDMAHSHTDIESDSQTSAQSDGELAEDELSIIEDNSISRVDESKFATTRHPAVIFRKIGAFRDDPAYYNTVYSMNANNIAYQQMLSDNVSEVTSDLSGSLVAVSNMLSSRRNPNIVKNNISENSLADKIKLRMRHYKHRNTEQNSKQFAFEINNRQELHNINASIGRTENLTSSQIVLSPKLNPESNNKTFHLQSTKNTFPMMRNHMYATSRWNSNTAFSRYKEDRRYHLLSKFHNKSNKRNDVRRPLDGHRTMRLFSEQFGLSSDHSKSTCQVENAFYNERDTKLAFDFFGLRESALYRTSTIYTRGDSSLGSDSGYSHHTASSTINCGENDISFSSPSCSTKSWTNAKIKTKTKTSS